MTNPATPPSGGGGMPKWLIIVLVVLLVIMLGCCGGFVACRWACARAGTALQQAGQAMTQKMADEQKKQGIEVDTTGNGLALPADFPADIPVYSGFKLRSKIAPPGEKSMTLSFSGAATPAALGGYYEKEMAANGWKQASATAELNSFAQTYTKDDRTVTVQGNGGAGASALQISLTSK